MASYFFLCLLRYPTRSHFFALHPRRLEIIGFQGQSEFNWLKSLGAFGEIIQWKPRVFVPTKVEVALEVIKRIRAN